MTRKALLAVGLALVVRAAVFPFADNKHGDAPMRALIAERMNLEPAAAANPRTYCQFGPLHTALMRPFLAVDAVTPRSSRYLSFLAGIAVFFPFLRLGRRLAGERAAELGAFALAVSPLHVQAATTAASEALYLLLWVAALERLLAALDGRRLRDDDLERGTARRLVRRVLGMRHGPPLRPPLTPLVAAAEPRRPANWPLANFAIAGLLASLAAVTRYDAWLALPVLAVAAALFTRPLPWRGLALFAACAALLPAAWLAWGALATDDALFFAHYISGDHAGLAATATARYGPWLGRARQLGVWSLSFVAAMTLPMVIAAGVGLARGLRALSPAMRVVLAAALAPPALYLGKGLLFLSFEPLPRFALVPGALLLPLAAAAIPPARARAARATMLATAVGFSAAVLLVATVGRPRIWGGAESLSPLTRLDGEDRALAAYLRAHRRPGERVMLEPLAFAEIAVAEQAGVPMTESITLTVTREPRATVAASAAATGARWLAGYDRPGGWPRRLPDWPAEALRFGGWRLVAR